MQAKLGRRVSILVAATDYFDVTNVPKSTGDSALLTRDNTAPHFTIDANEEWISRVYAPSYHIEKMKEELLRAKRYKHALSAVLLDIDNFSKVNEEHSLKTGDEILSLVVKIIKKTIRAVDIIARYSGDRFLIILPNTNRREAVELAERLRVHIADRSKLVAGVSEGVTATFAVGQCNQDDRSTEFLKMLEHRLDTGKQKTRNSIHICENC
jgi:diguanylate cyclase (GGDEF)-like protein